MGNITNITEWNAMVTRSKTDLVILDFYATWCGPCKTMASILKNFENRTKISVYKIDVDKATDLMDALGLNITSLPTLYFVRNGKVVSQTIGCCTESQLETKIKNCV